jgi:glyoxylase-like metal-dependent hydrolase (beta-lactamase superfamily II)
MSSSSTPPDAARPWGRRAFLGAAGGCLAHLTLLGAGGTPWLRIRRDLGGPVRAQEPWGSLVEIGEGVWALVSDPMADATTLCNGGIVAGRSGVAVVEAFASPAGAEWMAGQALQLAGRRPDVVVVSHYHRDHSGGLPGFGTGDGAPETWMTAATRTRLASGLTDAPAETAEPMQAALDRVAPREDAGEHVVDLGGRRLRLTGRRGHTASDVTVDFDDPPVVFGGDLIWNGMFPNYVDARPSQLRSAVASIGVGARSVVVPGHGALADAEDFGRYLDVLDAVEDHARAAHRDGRTAAEAAGDFRLPGESADWVLFSSSYFERALGAWLAELEGDDTWMP